MKQITLREVATQAGVSVSTASRVLSGGRTVNPELARLVHDAVDSLGYRPNLAARNLRTSRSMTLGAVFSRLDSPLSRTLLEGLEAGARASDYVLLLGNAGTSNDMYKTLMERFLERQVDALVVYRPPLGIDKQLADYQLTGTPVIALFAKPRGLRLPLVTNQPTEAIRRSVDQLAALGHRSIGYVATDSEVGDFRSELLTEWSERHGIRFELLQIPEPEDGDTIAATSAVLRSIADRGDRPTALFARYRHVPGLLIAAREQHWRIPGDLSVVSFGDGLWAEAHDPPIAAINTDGHEIGVAAAGTAIEAIKGSSVERRQERSGSIWSPRASIGPPALGVGQRLRRLIG